MTENESISCRPKRKHRRKTKRGAGSQYRHSYLFFTQDFKVKRACHRTLLQLKAAEKKVLAESSKNPLSADMP